MLQFSDFYV